MSTCGAIFAGHAADCNTRTKAGAEQTVLLFNREDIDLGTTVVDSTEGASGTHKISTFQLKAGKTGYKFQGLGDKQHIADLFEFIRNEEGYNEFAHRLRLRLYGLSETDMVTLKGLAKGANLVAMVESKSKGANNADAFRVLGFDAGLKLQEAVYDTNENTGQMPLVLSSIEPDLESNPPYIYFDTDYATSKAAFDLAFAQP